jgi:hypothetical protein
MLRSGCKAACLREWRRDTNCNFEAERLKSMNGTSICEGVLCAHARVEDRWRRKNKAAMCMQKNNPRAKIDIAFSRKYGITVGRVVPGYDCKNAMPMRTLAERARISGTKQ